MTSIYEYWNYREYLQGWLENQRTRRHGLKGQIAAALGISSSLISQILKGEKSLTSDQASDLADFLGLNQMESDYLHLLVEFDRAGNPRYREKIKLKIQSTQLKSQQIGNRVPRDKELSAEQKTVYYSSWLYSGVRNLTAVPGFGQIRNLAEYLDCEPRVISQIIQFLLENGLCREQDGKITYGPSSTHVDKNSPFVNQHHQNWRQKGIEQMHKRREDDFFFTSPLSLSMEAEKQIRMLLLSTIQSALKISGPSPSETVACLNVDFFRY